MVIFMVIGLNHSAAPVAVRANDPTLAANSVIRFLTAEYELKQC